jgi:hypothetical protein
MCSLANRRSALRESATASAGRAPRAGSVGANSSRWVARSTTTYNRLALLARVIVVYAHSRLASCRAKT